VLDVSVVYLRPGLAFERALRLPAPATVGAAIEASGIRDAVPELAGVSMQVGVFSLRRALADALRDGDRVEICRPLLVYPKAARRLRAAARDRAGAKRQAPG